MSEGSITYQGDGEACGISTVINSQLRNHRVCSDGLACMMTEIGDGVSTKTCQSVEVLVGERCLPFYDMCYGGVECLKNVFGDYTCGGEVIWPGNPDYVKSGYVKASEFEIDIPLVVIASVILFLYLVVIIYELFLRDNSGDSIYSKIFRKGTTRNGWCPWNLL